MAELDPDTIERFRTLAPRAVYDEVRAALYRLGPVSSDDFRDAYETLVEEGILSWEEIEGFEREG